MGLNFSRCIVDQCRRMLMIFGRSSKTKDGHSTLDTNTNTNTDTTTITTMPSLPRRQTAIVAQGPGKLAIQHDAPVPSLAPDIAIVKTAAVAINP